MARPAASVVPARLSDPASPDSIVGGSTAGLHLEHERTVQAFAARTAARRDLSGDADRTVADEIGTAREQAPGVAIDPAQG